MKNGFTADIYSRRQDSSTDILWLLAFVVILTLWRLSVHYTTDFTLYLDEAYYWYWAKHLDWGFYSKPPVIAGIIAATTSVCGDGELCVRAGSLIIYPFTSLLIFLIGARLFDTRVGLYSGVAFFTIPGVSLSSLLISTDVALLFFWALAFYAFIRAIEEEGRGWHWWILLGIAGGLGMLSKYTMGVFVFSALIYLALSGRLIRFLTNPGSWLAFMIAALIWLPNILWNAQHGFITFKHTSDIARGSEILHWGELAEFFFIQLGVFGLVLFPLLIWGTFSGKLRQHQLLLICFSWVFLFIIFAQALLGRANANWAAPAYIAASIFVSAWLFTAEEGAVTGCSDLHQSPFQPCDVLLWRNSRGCGN